MKTVAIPLAEPLFRGARRLRVALVGLSGAGTRTTLRAMTGSTADACNADIGFDQAHITRQTVGGADEVAPCDVIVQVVDATDLARHLELTRALQRLGRPLVVALSKLDVAAERGLRIDCTALSRQLCAPVVTRAPQVLAAAVARARAPQGRRRDWRHWLDELFLGPRMGLIGSAAVFAAVLFMVFDISARIDALTTAPLAAWLSRWTPQSTNEVVLRAVGDGLVGLIGIVVPYMIPLVLLLVALEHAGIMARIAYAAERFFRRVGLHGDMAMPLLLGLGCNVPALCAIGSSVRGRSRTIASLLVTFVPCSARSAIILAVAGKYLGAGGVLAVFAVAGLVIVVVGRLLHDPATASAAHIAEIPPYAVPSARALLAETWLRTRDILTIVTPLLVGGSVLLALLDHFGGAALVNYALSPLTSGWLGLPAVLGVPLLFGVLRKELSLAMIYQALGGFDVAAHLDRVQMFTFLLFLTLYVPCLSTFAVLARNLGARRASGSLALSIGVALAVSGAARAILLQL